MNQLYNLLSNHFSSTLLQLQFKSITHSPSSIQDHHLPLPVNHLPLRVNQFSSPVSTKDHHSISSSKNHCFSIHTKTLLKITLPSTKDIPILTGKHDWGPWDMAIWTLINCSNLLSHVHKDMLPGALYDLDLEPTFPSVITHCYEFFFFFNMCLPCSLLFSFIYDLHAPSSRLTCLYTCTDLIFTLCFTCVCLKANISSLPI